MDFGDFLGGWLVYLPSGILRKIFLILGGLVGIAVGFSIGYFIHESVWLGILWGGIGAVVGPFIGVLFAGHIIAALFVLLALVGYGVFQSL